MKLSLPLLFFASIATPSVFCHESKDDKPKVRRRAAASGTPPAHEKRDNFGTNKAGNTGVDGTHDKRTPAHEKRDHFGTKNAGNITTAGTDGTDRRTQTQENGYLSQTRIVGGTQASPNEYPYYGK
jgi:hypothetical protein